MRSRSVTISGVPSFMVQSYGTQLRNPVAAYLVRRGRTCIWNNVLGEHGTFEVPDIQCSASSSYIVGGKLSYVTGSNVPVLYTMYKNLEVHYSYIRHFHIQLFHVDLLLRCSAFYSTLIYEVAKTGPRFCLSLFGMESEKALNKTASRSVNARYPKVTFRM